MSDCVTDVIYLFSPLHPFLRQTFRMVDYEDELDLLTVVVTRREESGEVAVCLHDNTNGTMMKRILLQESWDEVSSVANE